MLEAIPRYILLGGAIIGSALVMIPVVGALASARGVASPIVLDATSPVVAVLWLAIGCAIAVALASAAGRGINAVVGLFALGCGIAALAMQTGTIFDVAVDGGGAWLIGIEGVAWAVVTLVATLVVYRVSGPLPDVPLVEGAPRMGSFAALTSKPALLSLACGVIAPIVAWFVLADSTSKGQAIGAAALGSMVAAMVGRLVAPKEQPILVFVAPVLAGAGAHLFSAPSLADGLLPAIGAGELPRLSRILPLDWVAGAFIGGSIGVGWARSFLHEGEGDGEAVHAAI